MVYTSNNAAVVRNAPPLTGPRLQTLLRSRTGTGTGAGGAGAGAGMLNSVKPRLSSPSLRPLASVSPTRSPKVSSSSDLDVTRGSNLVDPLRSTQALPPVTPETHGTGARAPEANNILIKAGAGGKTGSQSRRFASGSDGLACALQLAEDLRDREASAGPYGDADAEQLTNIGLKNEFYFGTYASQYVSRIARRMCRCPSRMCPQRVMKQHTTNTYCVHHLLPSTCVLRASLFLGTSLGVASRVSVHACVFAGTPWSPCYLVAMPSRVVVHACVFAGACVGTPNLAHHLCRSRPVNLTLLDLGCAPYVLYGVKYIDLVSLDGAMASQSHILTPRPFLFKMACKQNLDLRCVLISDPGTLGAGAKTRLESRIKKFKFTPHTVFAGLNCFNAQRWPTGLSQLTLCSFLTGLSQLTLYSFAD